MVYIISMYARAMGGWLALDRHRRRCIANLFLFVCDMVHQLCVCTGAAVLLCVLQKELLSRDLLMKRKLEYYYGCGEKLLIVNQLWNSKVAKLIKC